MAWISSTDLRASAGRGAGFAVFGNRLNHLLEVALVLVGVDRGRVIGTEARFLTFHQGAADFLVFGLFVFEVPDLKGLVSEKDGTLRARELDARGVAILGPGAGGGFDHSARTIDKLDQATQWSSTSMRSCARQVVLAVTRLAGPAR